MYICILKHSCSLPFTLWCHWIYIHIYVHVRFPRQQWWGQHSLVNLIQSAHQSAFVPRDLLHLALTEDDTFGTFSAGITWDQRGYVFSPFISDQKSEPATERTDELVQRSYWRRRVHSCVLRHTHIHTSVRQSVHRANRLDRKGLIPLSVLLCVCMYALPALPTFIIMKSKYFYKLGKIDTAFTSVTFNKIHIKILATLVII